MSETISRRQLALMSALAAAGTLAAAQPAAAYQGNMENALGSLHEALDFLRQSTPNKGGHRERAMQLIRDAIGEVRAGIDFAASHGGGGQ
jgi:hypothetical protein